MNSSPERITIFTNNHLNQNPDPIIQVLVPGLVVGNDDAEVLGFCFCDVYFLSKSGEPHVLVHYDHHYEFPQLLSWKLIKER